MLFPENARNAISKAFYDKEVEVLSTTETIDAEGGVVKNTPIIRSTFRGNVRFANLGELQTELGLTESIDISITCDTDVQISLGDLFRYQGKTYQASAVIPSDSHLTIAGKNYGSEHSN
ncbi:hypothetical protein IKD67_01750 [Candidatus Saccharibacteria bacterium]|nr:hypothetical protein [Candidatus Saccharibacteria bacterium]